MDNSTVQSRTVFSPIESPKHVFNFPETSTKSNNQQEFVNHGLTVWNQTRQQWVGNERSQTQCQIREPGISWNATYESLLVTKKPFRKPIPLFEMVDFLVDIWEEEGLYDDF